MWEDWKRRNTARNCRSTERRHLVLIAALVGVVVIEGGCVGVRIVIREIVLAVVVLLVLLLLVVGVLRLV